MEIIGLLAFGYLVVQIWTYFHHLYDKKGNHVWAINVTMFTEHQTFWLNCAPFFLISSYRNKISASMFQLKLGRVQFFLTVELTPINLWYWRDCKQKSRSSLGTNYKMKKDIEAEKQNRKKMFYIIAIPGNVRFVCISNDHEQKNSLPISRSPSWDVLVRAEWVISSHNSRFATNNKLEIFVVFLFHVWLELE